MPRRFSRAVTTRARARAKRGAGNIFKSASRRVTSNIKWASSKAKYYLGGGAHGAKMNKRYKSMKSSAKKRGTWPK